MGQIQAGIIPVTPFQQNCTILFDDETREGVIVDPGGDVDVILHLPVRSGAFAVRPDAGNLRKRARRHELAFGAGRVNLINIARKELPLRRNQREVQLGHRL